MFEQSPLIVVGLAGGAGVGKDTLGAKYFTNYGYKPIALADEIKRRVVASGKATWEEVYVTKPPHIRELLQQEGTERGRDVYGEDYWLEQLYVNLGYYNIRWGFSRFVVTDVRFPNEVTGIQTRCGRVFQVQAPTRYAQNGLSAEAKQHRSERALDGFTAYDGAIPNDIGQEAAVSSAIHTLLGEAYPIDPRFQNVQLGHAVVRADYIPPSHAR